MTDPPAPPDASDLQAIMDSSSDCIKVLDLEAHLLSMNAGGLATMELDDFSSCRETAWPTLWEGEAREQVERALAAARAGQTITFQGPARTFAGTPKWWDVRVSPLRDRTGNVTRLLAISRDITATRMLEQQLQESRQRLREHAQSLEIRVGEQERALEAFVRFTVQVASSTDLEALATAAGDIIQDVLGGATSGLYLVRGQTAFPVAFSSNTPAAVRVARQPGVPLKTPLAAEAIRARRTAFAQGDDGRVQSVGYASALSVTPYFSEGQPYALFATGTGRPIWTAQEQAIIESVGQGLGLALERAEQTRVLTAQRDALDRRTQELEAANEELDAFTYSASHDLRTPIRHVMGFADLAHVALTKNEPDKVLRNLNIVKQGATRMEQLIDAMLMLSRAGRQDFRPRWVTLEPLIAQALRDAQLEFPAQAIEMQAPPPTLVWGDPVLIQQGVTNLVSNAVKYSTVRATSEIAVQVQDDATEWVITVTDNGVGFDPRYAGKLFGIFKRLHSQEAFPGTGVGLATVRRIVLKHGGRVLAHSVEGQGATFGFTLRKPPDA